MTITLEISQKATAPESKPLVYIISTDEESRLVYQSLLEIWGYRVEAFETFENVSAAKKLNMPDVILMEMDFPFNLGLAALSRIKKSFNSGKIPVISISTFPQAQYRALALSGGADEYMVKPLDYDLLKVSLNEIKENLGDLSYSDNRTASIG